MFKYIYTNISQVYFSTTFTTPTLQSHCSKLPAPRGTQYSHPAATGGGLGLLVLISSLSPFQKGSLLSCHPHRVQTQEAKAGSGNPDLAEGEAALGKGVGEAGVLTWLRPPL